MNKKTEFFIALAVVLVGFTIGFLISKISVNQEQSLCHTEYEPKMTCKGALFSDFPEYDFSDNEDKYVGCYLYDWCDSLGCKPFYRDKISETNNVCRCKIWQKPEVREGEYLQEEYNDILLEEIKFKTKDTFYDKTEVCE